MNQLFKPMIVAAICLSVLACHNKNTGMNATNAGSKNLKNDSSLFLFVGTYTQSDSPAGTKSTGIYIYRMNRSTGALSYYGVSPQTTDPSYLCFHPTGKLMYAVNEMIGPGQAGAVSAFSLDTATMQLQFLNKVPAMGKYPCYISVDPSGKFVLVANYGTGNLSMFPIQDDGSLGEACFVVQHRGKGPHPNQEGPHAHMIVPSPEGKFIYTADLGTDHIQVYRIDTAKRQLAEAGSFQTAAGAGPRHIVFHPTQPWMYVVDELNGTVEAFLRNKENGSLKNFQRISTLPAGMTKEASAAAIHISPSGKYLYASNRAEVNNIAIFAINQQTGVLSPIGQQETKGKSPRSFTIDPSGNFLLVANQNTDNVVTFRIDQQTGLLHETGLVAHIPAPVCLKFY